jgi:transaldolase
LTKETEMATTPSPTAQLADAGVSIWLDDLSRSRITSGGLRTLIATRNVVGITTNPTIFATAVAGSDAYDEQIAALARAETPVGRAIFDLTTHDVAQACDVFRDVFDSTDGLDGRVSIEVSPSVAHDAAATVIEARELSAAVDRPNAYIKIPATVEGLTAIERCTAAGISVNVTLIFSLERYRGVIEAYLRGLEAAAAAGLNLSAIHSVASFFVSRVDTEVDRRLGALGTPEAAELRGKAGIANARLAYRLFRDEFGGDRATALRGRGANPQRPLWASTGVKNPTLRDTLYVEQLVASDVVNTMPEKTLEAFADHGEVRGDTITPNFADADEVLAALARVGIDFDDVTDTLEREGIEKFTVSWRELTDTVEAALQDARSKPTVTK